MLCASLVYTPEVAAQESAPEYIPRICPDPALAPRLDAVPNRQNQPVTLDSENLSGQQAGILEVSGSVDLRRADQRLQTESMIYDQENQTATIPGPLIYDDLRMHIEADRATYGFNTEQGSFTNVTYRLTGATGNGKANEVSVDGDNRTILKRLDYTTCPDEEPDWLLSAKRLELRHQDGIGIAKGARLRFKGVPILYVPWFSFPIDDRRKSGFLYPTLSNTNDNGVEFGIPYYWNIAPNQDATITPRNYTERGPALTGEYRFLTPKTAGQINLDYLPEDDKFSDKERYHYKVNARARLNRRWQSNLSVDRVSDQQYFQDFGLNLGETSKQFLRSSASLAGQGRYWNFSLLADDFQVLDETVGPDSEPYRRLPRMAYTVDRPLGNAGLQFTMDSELVYFDRDTGVTGARLDVFPRIGWNLEKSWGFVRPSAGFRYTSYNLNDTLTGQDDSPTRGTSVLSIDSGLYFDRSLKNGNLQTLEPRVFYLYVPFEDQSDLPDFDTSNLTFGFSQLFHTNRFIGGDRQADANQMTLALTTRTLDAQTGRERWGLSVGQILQFEDQRVQLGSNNPVRDDFSPFIAELNWHPMDRFTTRFGLQWDWEDGELDVGTLGFDYGNANGIRVGFEYRFRRDRVDQYDLRMFWPINDKWRVLGRVNYSFDDSDLLETQLGVEYESCCWAVRVVSRKYLRNREGQSRNGIFLELQLKGLGNIGRRPRPLFNDLDRYEY